MLQDLLIMGALLFGMLMMSIRWNARYLYDPRQRKSANIFLICLSIFGYLVIVITALTDQKRGDCLICDMLSPWSAPTEWPKVKVSASLASGPSG